MTAQALTTSDLEAALGDERHLGFGYAISRDLGESRRKRLDRAVVRVANDLDLDAETLFHWANSKWGRLVDGVYGRNESPSSETVRNYLNEKAVAEALDGVEVRS